VHGTEAYAEAIDKAVTLARLTAEEIHRRPHLELIREPDLSIVLFRRTGWKPDDYHRWAEALHRDDVAFIPPTSWEGEVVGRFAFLHPHTTMDLVCEILDRTAD
jgi:glutamate/tyrosine decarboxylase-like PLP-dependent enzyme